MNTTEKVTLYEFSVDEGTEGVNVRPVQCVEKRTTFEATEGKKFLGRSKAISKKRLGKIFYTNRNFYMIAKTNDKMFFVSMCGAFVLHKIANEQREVDAFRKNLHAQTKVLEDFLYVLYEKVSNEETIAAMGISLAKEILDNKLRHVQTVEELRKECIQEEKNALQEALDFFCEKNNLRGVLVHKETGTKGKIEVRCEDASAIRPWLHFYPLSEDGTPMCASADKELGLPTPPLDLSVECVTRELQKFAACFEPASSSTEE